MVVPILLEELDVHCFKVFASEVGISKSFRQHTIRSPFIFECDLLDAISFLTFAAFRCRKTASRFRKALDLIDITPSLNLGL
jgi:hypothetical protein